MARAQKRAGYGSLRGASNPNITVGTEKPKRPRPRDIHIDDVRGRISICQTAFASPNPATWVTYSMIFESDTEPTNTNVLWLDES
jgi:hypothetical protein